MFVDFVGYLIEKFNIRGPLAILMLVTFLTAGCVATVAWGVAWLVFPRFQHYGLTQTQVGAGVFVVLFVLILRAMYGSKK